MSPLLIAKGSDFIPVAAGKLAGCLAPAAASATELVVVVVVVVVLGLPLLWLLASA